MSEVLKLIRKERELRAERHTAVLHRILALTSSPQPPSPEELNGLHSEEARLEAGLNAWRQAEAIAQDNINSAEESRREAWRQWSKEDAAFWLRRFHVSLAIAHGGAFAAIMNNLFSAKDVQDLAAVLFWPLTCFGTGLLTAGVIPVALYRRARTVPWLLAALSGMLFVAGVVGGLAAVFYVGDLQLPWPSR
ncbi:MAG: hypothetical protein ACM3YN_04710 [Parcubacteria group bacterium]